MSLRIASALLSAAIVAGCSDPPSPTIVSATPEHVGRAVCAECHANEARAWEGSHHDLAMQPASAATVLGDFDDAEFTYVGVTSRFFRDGDRFMVRTDGADGKLREFEIAYTFGVEPLQQYLIEFPDGRLQTLGICWDTRPADAGGQRWFHIYPDEAVDHEDVLHWTGALQNWNYMCSECHSTRLKKNYVAAEDRYETSWSEIDVSCEACHGPGSRHVAWARESERNGDSAIAELGLEVRLKDADGGSWNFDEGALSATRSVPRTSRTEIETCARCHSRRTQLTDDYRHGKALADTHRIALLSETLYHADGQIKDEVYVYGSFLQSKMFHKGVSCGDCHDPHRASLRGEGNALCYQCHQGNVFDAPEHHYHPPGSSGASCVGCHMPTRDYMVVDPRHDHGFRVPRPDLSVKLGTPNTCNDCHVDRDAAWAAEAVAAWYVDGRQDQPHFAETLHAAHTRQPRAGVKLVELVGDPEQPGIVRATALTLLGEFPAPGAAETIERSINDKDPLVRRSAAESLELFEPGTRLRLGIPLLDDPLRTVRIAAARVLSSMRQQASPQQREAITRALEEYAEVQRFNGDRAEGQLNLAWYHVEQGQLAEAEAALFSVIEAAPRFTPAAVNLADLYRAQGREEEGEAILRDALTRSPGSANLHHALALTLIRQQRHEAALEHLERATSLAPDQPHYAYVFAVALHSLGRSADAIDSLERTLARYPAEPDLLFMLAAIHRDLGQPDDATRYAQKALDSSPGHAGARALLGELSR